MPAFLDEMQRCEQLGLKLLNFHPGSHVGQGAETGIAKIAEILNEVLTKEQSTTVLLETMSGKGSEVGRNFQELRQIIDQVELKEKLGVCLDTCHVWMEDMILSMILTGYLLSLTRLSVLTD